MPQDARNKLRNMGGIMASYPELMQAATQRYQAGGPVMATPVVPRVDSVTVPGVGAPVVGLGRVPPMQPPRPVAGGVPALTAEVPAQRYAAGINLDPYAPSPNSYLMGAGDEPDVTVDDLLDGSGAEGFSVPEARAPKTEAQQRAERIDTLRRDSVEAAAEFVRGLPNPAEALSDYANIFGAEAAGVVSSAVGATETGAEFFEAAEGMRAGRERRQDSAAAQERKPGTTPAPPRPVYDNPVFMENLLPPGAEEPSRAETIKKRAEEELSKDAETTAPQPDTGGSDTGAGTGTGGGAGGPGPRTPRREPTKKDLRSRYKEKIELFKEIYGEDDEDRARDKAMSLAMLGLAIASGQSPNALTNIAQGAMAGVQGMSEQEQARREREQGLQTLALETAIGEMDAEREAQARAAEQEAEFQNRLDVARIRADGKGPGMNRIESAADLLAIERELVAQEIDKGVFIPEKGREQESTQEYINQNVLRSLNLYKAQNLIDDQVYNNVLKTLGVEGTSGGASQANPALQARITEDLKTKSPEQIKAALRAQGIDPSPYEGL